MRTFETPNLTGRPAASRWRYRPNVRHHCGSRESRGKAVPGAVADKYSSVSPGRIARYLRGTALLQAGDKAGAEQELKTAAAFSDKDVAGLAKMALASIYRGTNRTPEAIAIYKELSDHPTVTVPKSQAQLELAEIYETTDPQQATLIYQQLQKDDPRSPAAQVAGQRLKPSK